MGEKIRDIHPIKIGNTSFMIELNEGYHASQGRLIHIQNPKFRYLFKEKDFYQLSSMVLRAFSEFTYIKSKKIEVRQSDSFGRRDPISAQTMQQAKEICEKCHQNDISIKVLDIQNRLITVLIHPHYANEAKKLLTDCSWTEKCHPYGAEAGYKFLYQMNPFGFYQKNDVFIEVYSHIPCASLTPNMWIPLDQKIQSAVWQEDDVTSGELPWCPLECQYLYHICWAVFFNKGFSEYQKGFISKNKSILSSDAVVELLASVFFGFTEELIQHIHYDRIEQIIPAYYAFQAY